MEIRGQSMVTSSAAQSPLATQAITSSIENLTVSTEISPSPMVIVSNEDPFTIPTKNLPFKFHSDINEQEMLSDKDCDLAIRLMDQRYSTRFHAWIKNEKNIDHIVQHLKPMIAEFNMDSTARAYRWMFEGWSVNSMANLLIKMYYEKGLGDLVFSELVSLILHDRESQMQVDLLATLMIGEEANVNATFLFNLMTSMKSSEVEKHVMLVDLVGKRSRWTPVYYQDVLKCMSSLVGIDLSVSEIVAAQFKTEIDSDMRTKCNKLLNRIISAISIKSKKMSVKTAHMVKINSSPSPTTTTASFKFHY